jgi:DNA-directed RNA polymerase subunit RPC12/RpoP|tara:strand:+ start:957 stop:1220 length:264 start_codon:yes stop_codon:yes gene_type:complete
MPKYRYACDSCSREWWEWASIGDEMTVCPYCNNGVPKKIPVNFVVIQGGQAQEKTVKQNVVDHIEENREILKKMRQNAIDEDILKND